MSRPTLVIASVLVSVYLMTAAPATAGRCWGWSNHAATNPQPWTCNVCDDGVCPGDVLGQNIRHEHRNWHCDHIGIINDPEGRALGPPRQLRRVHASGQ